MGHAFARLWAARMGYASTQALDRTRRYADPGRGLERTLTETTTSYHLAGGQPKRWT
jgi:hypothetical protein